MSGAPPEAPWKLTDEEFEIMKTHAVTDVYDALRNERPYKNALPLSERR